MMFYLGPVVLIATLVTVLLWVAHLVPGDLAWRIVVGLWLAFLVGTTTAAFRTIVARRRRRPQPDYKPHYLYGTAGGPIATGDLVRYEIATGTVTRLTELPIPEEGIVQ